MTTNGKFGTLTIKNNGEQDVTQNCILNLGVNVIGSSVNANVRLYDTNVDQQHCIVEVKEDGLVTVAALHIFPQTKINNLALLKNRKVALKNGDVLKISNTEITYNNDIPRTCNQAAITKQIKQKIFPFNTPRRRSCNVTSSSAKKAPLASGRLGSIDKQSLFSPSPLIVKKNLPPKHNDDWPSEPLDRDQFPFVGHFSPQKKERPLQDIPEATSGLEDILLKPSSPSLVNVVAPTVRTSTCTSTSDFDKKKNEDTMIPDVKSEISINSNDASLNSSYKPSVHVSACLSGRKSSLPAQNTYSKTSKRQNRSSSCVTPTKSSRSSRLTSRLTCSAPKLCNESQPSFLQSKSIEMENLTISNSSESSELNSSTPTAVRTSNNLTLLGTPTSIIKKRDSMLSLNKMDKTNIMNNSEACEKSKSRLFDHSLESVDGDSLAVSTDTSSFVYESALAVLPSVDDFEVEEIVEDFQVSVAPVSKSLNSSTIALNDSDISGIASLASTPEPKHTISNYGMISNVDFGESTSNQTDLSYGSTISVHNDEDTLKDSQFEHIKNYSSITISSNENLDTSDAGSLSSDLIDLREPSFEDEMEEIRRDSKRRISLDMEPQSEACNSMHRLSQILNIDKQKQETLKSTSQIQNIEEEVIPINAEFQSSTVQIATRSSARKSEMFLITDEETNSSSIQAIENESGNGSSLILAMDQEDEPTDESSVIEKKVNETFTLTETPAKMTENSETLQTKAVQNEEIEDNDESWLTEKIEIVPERKSKGISLRQGTPVASGNSSTRKSKICQLPKIRLNDQTIEFNDSEDTDASTASESKSKRKSKLLKTPVKNSPASSEVRSTRKSKIPQVIELNDSEDNDNASTTSDGKSKRNEKLFQTPVKNSPAVSVVRSTRKSSIQTPILQEGSDCNTSVQISEDTDVSVVIQTPLIQGSLIAFGDRSANKSQVLQTSLLKEDEVFGFDDSEDTDSSVSIENTPSTERSPIAANVRSIRKSKIVQTPLLQDDNDVENQDVLVARKSKRISKVFQTSLNPDSPLIPKAVLQNDEGSDYSQSDNIGRSLTGEVRSTRKSNIVQTPSLLVDEIVESEDIPASGRKSRRISNALKTPSVSGTPISSASGSTRKSKLLQTPLLEKEETSESEDMDDSFIIKNKSKRTSALHQTPSMSSPAVANVRSTRKSKIVQTPTLPDYKIVEPEDALATTDRKSKRISTVLQTSSILDSSLIPEAVWTKTSEDLETFVLQNDEGSDYSESENIGKSLAGEVRSTRKSKIVQTPSLQVDEIVESEDIPASGRKSRRISNALKTPSVSDTPISSASGSARKSKLLQQPLLEKEETSESEDMDDSFLIKNKSKRTSALLQTPSMSSPAVANVRSTRKSKIVQTPTLPDDKIVVPEDTLAATDRKSKIISTSTSRVDSTTKSQVLETSKSFDSSDSENMDDSVSTSIDFQASSIQGSPAAVEVRSTRKSKIVQTPSLQGDKIVEAEDISASGRKSRRISNVMKTPSISGTPITSGIGSTRKSKILQTPLLENTEASQSRDLEDVDDLIFTENESRCTSSLLQTPSTQPSPFVAEVKSTRKSKIVESQDSLAGTERKSKRISKALQTSEVESQVFDRSVLQDEAHDSSGSEDMDDSVFTDNDSRTETALPQAQPVQCTPTSLQDDEIVESENVSASGRKSRRISNILKTPSVSGTPITSGVVSARKSKIFQTPLLEDEEEIDDSILTKNKSKRTSTLLQTPSMLPSPAVAEVRSTRKSKIVSTPSLQDDIEGNNDEEADQLEDASPVAANKSRTSKLPSTPLVQSLPASSGGKSTRKSKILNTPLLQNEETLPVLGDDTQVSTNAVALDVLNATENETDRKSKRISKIPSLQNTPTASGVVPTRKSKILQTPLSEKEPAETETLLQTPSMHDLPSTSGVRSTRKSKVSKTPLLLNNQVDVETEEIDTPVNKSNLLSTPQSSPVGPGVRSTRKSKISATPTVVSAMQTRRGSKAPQTPMIQEEANTSKRTSKLLPTNLDSTPGTSGIQVKRTSQVLKTPSMQDFNQTNSPRASGIKSKRISKLQQTPLIQEETNSSNVSGRKSVTPKNMEKSKTPVSSAIKPQRISKTFETSSLIDFEEIESPLASPVKTRNTSKVLTFNTPTDKDDSESEVETSPAPKRRKIGGRTAANTEPHNDLTDVQGVKGLFKTPKVQKQPHDDLTDVRGVKAMLKTPKAVKEPKNDLTNVKGVKKLMATPKVQNSPANDLTNVGGVKKLMKTPRAAPKEPRNDLSDIQGVKKLMATPTKQKSPHNDLSDVRGVKQLVVTPKPRKSANLSGLGDFFATTSKTTTPKHGLSEVRGVKKILDIKKSKKSLKVQNSPKNDLTNVVGVKKMFAEEEAEYNSEFNVSGVAEIMNKSDELFNSLLDKKPPKTYGRKSTPVKLDASVKIGVVSETPVMSEQVVNWVNTQDFNKGEVVDNLTPIKSKNNENLLISKKQDVAIHSSTPLNKGNRGILKEIEANLTTDIESNDAISDKNLKKVQFLDDSNLRKSKRTPRTPSKIATEFVMTTSKGHKRKADKDEHLNLAKVPKMVSESNEASAIIIDSGIDLEDAVTRKVLPKKGAKKAPPKAKSKKTMRANSNRDKVEEESVNDNQEDEKVEAPKTTRGRAIRKTNKKVVEVESNEEINASNEEKIENETIEAPKTTRSRAGKKTNAKMTKKVEKLQIENTEEISENVEENEEIEAPKTTRSRNLKKIDVKTSINENSIEEIEAPKTRRGRALQKTKTKTSTQMKKVEDDKNSDNEEVRADEEVEVPKATRGRPTKKTSAKNLKVSLTEEKNESLRKTTRSRKVEKKSEPEKQLDSSVEILSDEEKDEPIIEVPKKTRGRPASKTNEEIPENNVDDEIEAPKTTRGRPVKKTSAKNLKASLTEEKNESLKKNTRLRKVAKTVELEKQLDSSVEILSDEEKDEPAIEVQKTTRGRTASKTSKQVPKKSTRLRAAPRGKKVAEVETSINSTLENSKVKVVEISVNLSKTKRTRGIKRSLEVESTEEQENSITANQKKNSKRLKGESDGQLEKELEVSKTTRRRPVVTKTSRANKNSIENSEMEESKNESVRGRKTKAAVQSESKSEEESKGAKTRGKRKLYSLDDSVKVDVEEVVKVEVKKVVRTRNVKEKTEVVAPVRSSKRTRK